VADRNLKGKHGVVALAEAAAKGQDVICFFGKKLGDKKRD